MERLGASTTVNNRWYCPGCGSTNLVHQDHKRDYWYILAEGFGLPANEEGANLIKDIYNTWDTTEYAKFADYMRSLQQPSAEQATA